MTSFLLLVKKPLDRNSAIAILFFAGIIMGFSPVFVRESGTGAYASAFWRVALALPFLYMWMVLESGGKHRRFILKFSTSSVIAGLMFSGDLVFWHLSILHTTMANATFTVCLSVIWVALLSGLFLGEKITIQAWLGLLICLAGLALLVRSSLLFEPQRLLGDLYGIITSFFLGMYVLAMRAGRRSMKSGQLFLSSSVITCAVLFLVMVFFETDFIPEKVSGWMSLFSLGVLTHVGGQGLTTVAMGVLSAMFSSLVIFIEAIAAAIFGWWLFDENMSAIQLAGGVFILIGVWMARPRSC